MSELYSLYLKDMIKKFSRFALKHHVLKDFIIVRDSCIGRRSGTLRRHKGYLLVDVLVFEYHNILELLSCSSDSTVRCTYDTIRKTTTNRTNELTGTYCIVHNTLPFDWLPSVISFVQRMKVSLLTAVVNKMTTRTKETTLEVDFGINSTRLLLLTFVIFSRLGTTLTGPRIVEL